MTAELTRCQTRQKCVGYELWPGFAITASRDPQAVTMDPCGRAVMLTGANLKAIGDGGSSHCDPHAVLFSPEPHPQSKAEMTGDASYNWGLANMGENFKGSSKRSANVSKRLSCTLFIIEIILFTNNGKA